MDRLDNYSKTHRDYFLLYQKAPRMLSPKRFLYPLAFVNFGPHGLHTGLPYLGIFGVGRSHPSNPVTDYNHDGGRQHVASVCSQREI